MIKKVMIDQPMLQSYVDGELDQSAIAEVEAWLRENPEDRKRVAEWQQQSAMLKKCFDPVAEQEVPARWNEIIFNTNRTARWMHWGRQAIAASLLLAFGALGGWYLGPQEPGEITSAEIFYTQAMSAHVVFAADLKRAVEITADQKAPLINWLSNRLGQQLSVPDFSAVGFELLGGRLLADDARPAAQFMYENSEGQRISLYIAGNPAGLETQFRIVTADATKSFYWLDGPLGFAVTGDVGQDELLRVAKIAYEQL